jgi:prephenate dehydratase
MQQVIVGYQGIGGSHTERAAIELLARAGITEYRLEACVTAQEVVTRLQARRVDLGVLALRNVVGGEVIETQEATREVALHEHARGALPIVHALYARAARPAAAIATIYSHEQALRQCAQTLRQHCPQAQTVPAPDTAFAARLLAEGQYAEDAAVLCSRAAGEQFGLCLIRDGMQDRADNLTEFALVGLALDPRHA